MELPDHILDHLADRIAETVAEKLKPMLQTSSAPAPTLPDKQVFTVEEVGKILRLGRSAAYEAVRTGQIQTVKIGKKILVPRAVLEKMLTGGSL